ncbi:uncharacterized protein LOC144706018 [Wolffia australiana]
MELQELLDPCELPQRVDPIEEPYVYATPPPPSTWYKGVALVEDDRSGFLPRISIGGKEISSSSSDKCHVIMVVRLGLLFLLFLSIKCINADVKGVEESVISNKFSSPIYYSSDFHSFFGRQRNNNNLCTLCEEFASQALDYFNSNKTQEEPIERLHHACSQLHHLKEQCISLVDYYAPHFFVEVGSVQPEAFCKKVDLCGAQTAVPTTNVEEICSTCQQTILEVLTKLKDPETQVDIIQVFLKACNNVEQYKQQKLVFEYGLLILVNTEKFLETTDLCKAVCSCQSSKAVIVSP